MTDSEIIKALKCCGSGKNCEDCFFIEFMMGECNRKLSQHTLELINRQKAEIERCETIIRFADKTIEKVNAEVDKLTYTIMGIMHSVDKWLDGDDLKKDEVTRAATMREKTLQITEKQQAEIENLKKFCNDFSETLSKNHSKAEVEKWQAVDSAINGFADEAIKRICERVAAPTHLQSYIVERCNEEIHNLVKEMVGE